MMGISTLLATLSILPYDRNDTDDSVHMEQEKERVLKMANILGFTVVRGRLYCGLALAAALLAGCSCMLYA